MNYMFALPTNLELFGLYILRVLLKIKLSQITSQWLFSPITVASFPVWICSLQEFSPDGRFIVSADRDFEIRVSVFPKNPLKGVHEIQSFCLGHSEFVSCVTFVHNSDLSESFLVSGSGDSTVCLWDVTSGSLLCKCEVGREAGLSEECHSAVTDLCATPDGLLVAVAVQSLQGILLLSCDLSARALSVLKLVPIPGEIFIPTKLGMSSSGDLLWIVTGASNLPGSKATVLARVRVMSGFKKGASDESDDRPRVLEDEEIPGGEQLREKLQGSVSAESAVFSAVADKHCHEQSTEKKAVP